MSEEHRASSRPQDPPLDLPAELAEAAGRAERVVAFTGAGVSKESGLSTFRDEDGLWARFRPEEVATPQAFSRRPEHVWAWYAQRYRQMARARPNPGHRALVRLEGTFPSVVVVTQNVDGLHQRAGSGEVLELHGTLITARCHRCGRERPMEEALESSPDTPPECECGGLFRPAVVWFGEMLPEGILERAFEEVERADLFLAVGTAAEVYPAAGLIDVAHRSGSPVVEVNPAATPFSSLAALTLRQPAGIALPALVEAFARCRRNP